MSLINDYIKTKHKEGGCWQFYGLHKKKRHLRRCWKTRFDTSIFEMKLMKDDLGGRIMAKFVALLTKIFNCFTYDKKLIKQKKKKGVW